MLIADDSEADIFFLLRAFEASQVQNKVFVTRSGRETLDFLAGTGEYKDRNVHPLPRIIFLDLYMPGVSGFDILRWKNSRPEYDESLFIALSNSHSIKDISRAYDLGANTFLTKPMEGSQVHNLLEAYQRFWSFVSPRRIEKKAY